MCQFVIKFRKVQEKVMSQNKSENSDLNKGLYSYDDHRIGGGQALKICHVFADSIVFEQLTYCSFLPTAGVGVKKFVLVCVCHKWMTPNLSD